MAQQFGLAPGYTPELLSSLQGISQQAAGQLKKLPQANFEPLKQKAITQFESRTVPRLLETLGGGHGTLGSSALLGGLSSAGGQLSENLAAMEQGFNQQQFQNMLQLLNAGLGGIQSGYYAEEGGEQQNPLASILGPLLQIGTQFIPYAGPFLSPIAGGLGNKLASYFGKSGSQAPTNTTTQGLPQQQTPQVPMFPSQSIYSGLTQRGR